MTTRTDDTGQEPMDDVRQLETPADGVEPVIETRERPQDQAEAPEARQPEIRYGTAADRKRNAVNERFQRQRDEERGARIDRPDEAERMMGGHNLQTRSDREAAEAEAKAQDAADITAADIPAPRRVTLTVNGQQREVDEEQVKNYAQIALASEDILNTAKREREAANEERRLASEGLAELNRLRADHSRSQAEQPDPAQTKAEDTKPATEEELDSLIEAIQTGEIEDARKALQKHGDQIGQQVEKRILEKIGDIDQRIANTTRRRDEDARVHTETMGVINTFLAENEDFNSHPKRGEALISESIVVMRENLAAIGVKDETITNIAQKFNVPRDIAVSLATRRLREQGYELPDGATVMQSAAKRVREGFGLPDPTPRKAAEPQPARQVDPTPSILADRDARKAAMAPQPRRATVTPGPDLGPAKSKEELAREHIRAVKVSRRRY